MKILFFNYEYPPLGGGAAHATAQIFKSLSAYEDIHIDLITSAITDQNTKEKVGKNITIHRIPIGKNSENLHFQSQRELLTYTYQARRYAHKLIKVNDYDFTHSFFTVPCGILSLYCKIFFNLSYIISLRGSDVPGYSERFTLIYKIFTPIIKTIWHFAHFRVTNSAGLTMLAKKSSNSSTFEEIFNGIDLELFSDAQKKRSQQKSEFIILCAARLTHRKGFQYVLDAVALIVEQYPQIKVILAGGDGGMLKQLEGQAQALGLEGHVTFTGPYTKDNIGEVYENADVFVMPSFNEGMSNNTLEALASGLPIIMTPTGGAHELAQKDVNGFIVDFMESQKIAQHIRDLINNPEKKIQMGKESLRIAKTLSWDKTANQYYNLYKKMPSAT